MPTDIIEMFWGCLVCNSDNKGRFKTCQNCGKPRSEDSPEWMPDDVSPMAAVKDPELLAKFKAGADWKCRFCDSSQFRADGNCAQCGSAQGDSVKKVETPAVHPKTDMSDKDKACRGELTKDDIERMLGKNRPHNPALEELLRQRQQARQRPEPAPFVPHTGGYRDPPDREVTPPPSFTDVAADVSRRVDMMRPPRVPRFNTPSRGTLIGAGVAILVGLALYLIFRTKVIDAQVAAVSWDRSVAVERYQVYRHEGWDPDLGAFDVVDEGRKVHHYDHVRVGSHQESYQEQYQCGETCTTVKGSCYTTPRSCTSNKNGSATCTGGDRVCNPDTKSCSPKYCNRTAYRTVDDYEDQPRYRDWYSWKVWEWGHNRDVRASGTSTKTHWPSDEQIRLGVGLGQGEQERISGRTEHYRVTLAYNKDTYKYEPKSDAEFQHFTIGDRHKIKVGIAHGVEILPR